MPQGSVADLEAPLRKYKPGGGFHWPGANYMGPGTPIQYNVLTGVQPTSRVDAVALTHDVNYLLAGQNPGMFHKADRLATSKIGVLGIKDNVMRIGLSIRELLHLKEKENGRDSVVEGQILKDIILYDDRFKKVRTNYGIDETYFIDS